MYNFFHQKRYYVRSTSTSDWMGQLRHEVSHCQQSYSNEKEQQTAFCVLPRMENIPLVQTMYYKVFLMNLLATEDET